MISFVSVGKTDPGASCDDTQIVLVDQSFVLIVADVTIFDTGLIVNSVSAATLAEPLKSECTIEALAATESPPEFRALQSVNTKKIIVKRFYSFTGNSRKARDGITQRV